MRELRDTASLGRQVLLRVREASHRPGLGIALCLPRCLRRVLGLWLPLFWPRYALTILRLTPEQQH
jgi:hypothetical protein